MTSTVTLDPREEHYFISSSRPDLKLFVRRLPPRSQWQETALPVLYIHGATFPSALSIAHRFDGYSWRDAVCDAGWDVWSFDFHGFGYSDRYPKMDQPAQANSPLCLAEDASEQLEMVVRFILQHQTKCLGSAIPGARCRRAVLPDAIPPWSTVWFCSARSRDARRGDMRRRRLRLRGAS